MNNLWEIKRTNQFKKQYKKLNPEIQTKVDEAIKDLVLSENPGSLGEYKKHMKVFAYELGKKLRVIYDLDFKSHTLGFIRVGYHKDVYGDD